MDAMGFTEREWEETWESETATGTVYRPSDDEDKVWQAFYRDALLADFSEARAVEYADAAMS